LRYFYNPGPSGVKVDKNWADNEPVTYTQWAPGRPNYGQTDDWDGDCVSMYGLDQGLKINTA